MSIDRIVANQLSFDHRQLYFGDNLVVLRRHVADESVDLIYLDPPFNSGRDYNVLFKHKDGTKPAAQLKAFTDTWEWNEDSSRAYEDLVAQGGTVSSTIRAFRQMLGGSDMLAYLTMMSARLVELRRVLKQTGSLYLHCDPTASHYLKTMLDAIFGPHNFRSEVIWKRTGAHGGAHRWGPVHDVLLFYSASPEYTWNPQYQPYTAEYRDKFNQTDARGDFMPISLTGPGIRHGDSGLSWRNVNPTTGGRHWQPSSTAYDLYELLTGESLAALPMPQRLDRMDDAGLIWWPKKKGGIPRFKQYLQDMPGLPAQDIISDIPPIGAHAAERLGYPTQKPLALLERIIRASSNTGDVVLDPFCGCGTAVDAAERLKRRWVGIDITEVAIEVIRKRLVKQYGPVDYYLGGEPSTIEEAEALARLDKHEFERWVCETLGIKAPHKKGADRGIDGEIVGTYEDGSSWRAIVSVKGGGVNVTQIRDLRGTIAREHADIGVLVSLKSPTGPMRREATDAGFTSGEHSRIQILTVDDLFAGKRPDLPQREEKRERRRHLRAM